jgi:hypothetical protein
LDPSFLSTKRATLFNRDYQKGIATRIVAKPNRFDYVETMATVLRRDGFDFRIYTKDHEPEHVHIVKAGEVVIVVLTNPVSTREIHKMKDKDVRRAVVIAQEERALLLAKWQEMHGE